MIKDRLNLQGNTLKMLEENCTLFLDTEKGLKLIVALDDREVKKEKSLK